MLKGVSQYAPAVVVAASQIPASSLGESKVPALFFGPVKEGPLPGSSVADIPASVNLLVLVGLQLGHLLALSQLLVLFFPWRSWLTLHLVRN